MGPRWCARLTVSRCLVLGVALLYQLYGDRSGVDFGRILRPAVVHDLAEAETGDVTVLAGAGIQRMSDDEKAPRRGPLSGTCPTVSTSGG